MAEVSPRRSGAKSAITGTDTPPSFASPRMRGLPAGVRCATDAATCLRRSQKPLRKPLDRSWPGAARAYDLSAENYRAMALAQGHPSTIRAIGIIVSGLVPVFAGGRRIDAIPFTHEGIEIARPPDDNRAAMDVHGAAAGARGGDQGCTFSAVARIVRAGPGGAETSAQAAHAFRARAKRTATVGITGTGGRTAWYRHPATAATVAAALTGAEEGTRSDEPLDERAARGAMARACPGGVGEEQTPSVEWDGHGSGGGTDSGEWETRSSPGDAVAFAIEPGG